MSVRFNFPMVLWVTVLVMCLSYGISRAGAVRVEVHYPADECIQAQGLGL